MMVTCTGRTATSMHGLTPVPAQECVWSSWSWTLPGSAFRAQTSPWMAATTGHRQRSQAFSESCIRSISARDRSAERPGQSPSFRQLAIRPAAMERSMPAQKFLPLPVNKICKERTPHPLPLPTGDGCENFTHKTPSQPRAGQRPLTTRTPSWPLSKSSACRWNARLLQGMY